MSSYTTQLRFYIESFTPPTMPRKDRMIEGIKHLFDFEYPIWNESYKEVLEMKIVRHYYQREVGLETMESFKLYLEDKLNLIMPYYNQLYLTTTREYDYLTNTKLEETYDFSHSKNDTGNFSTNSSGNSNITDTGVDKTTGLQSDTPQINYGGVDYATELMDNTIDRNNQTESTSTGTETGSNSLETTSHDTYTKNVNGLNGGKTYTELIQEYRKSILNIDLMIVNELKDLFMMIY